MDYWVFGVRARGGCHSIRGSTIELLKRTQFQEVPLNHLVYFRHYIASLRFEVLQKELVSLFQSWALIIVWDSCGGRESTMLFIQQTFTDCCVPCSSIGVLQMTWPGLLQFKRAGHLDARILVLPGVQVLNSCVIMEKSDRKFSQGPLNY